jgi:uncharacterized protein YkwD
MIAKLSTVLILITLVLSACTPQAVTEPAVPASTEVQPTDVPESPTEAPSITDLPPTEDALPPPSEATATPAATQPPNDPNCTNSAAFVTDITVPDNTNIGAGTPFTKTWRVSNTGTCIWGPGYTLSHYSDERMSAPPSVPLAVTYPGQTADISVNLTAPNSAGNYRGNFVIKNPAGLIMRVNDDSRLWLIINVTTDTSAATAVSGVAGLAAVTCAFTSETVNITETLNAITAYRARSGLPAYNTNSQLARAAQAHANDMACNNFFGHTGSNGSTIQSRVTASGYTYSVVTENVYGSYPPLTGQGAVNWWINDKTNLRHNRNLISDTYTDVGVGYSFFNNYGYYVVVFGTP